MIMHVRDIPEVQAAFDELQISKIWLTGYTEDQLADGVHAKAIEDTDYDFYICVSDDVIVRAPALNAVKYGLKKGMPVVTGYSQRTHTEWVVNVISEPIWGRHPCPEAYKFRSFQEVISWPDPIVPTWFAGMSLTGMSKEMWRKYPFGCYIEGQEIGYASDFHLSLRLQDDNVPIVAMREAFCYHWRNEWRSTNHPDDANLFIYERIPHVEFEDVGVVA